MLFNLTESIFIHSALKETGMISELEYFAIIAHAVLRTVKDLVILKLGLATDIWVSISPFN